MFIVRGPFGCSQVPALRQPYSCFGGSRGQGTRAVNTVLTLAHYDSQLDNFNYQLSRDCGGPAYTEKLIIWKQSLWW